MEDWESKCECEDEEIEEIAHPGSLPVLDIGSRGGLSVEAGLGMDLNFDEYQEESDVRSDILLTSADTSSSVESPDLSTKLLLLAPKACGCSYIPPPSEEQAKIALEKLALVLHPPHKTGGGYKDPRLDILTHM